MTSYLSSLTQHYTTLKRLLPNSLSPDSDLTITNPEDSHVSRVLRAYYTEKGRPFPPWLGPDPNAPARATPAIATNNYGNPQASAGLRRSGGLAVGGGLGDLFGESPGPQIPQKDEPLSLRSRRRLQPTQTQTQEPQPTARPLPSQRMGSNQSRGSASPAFSENPYSPPPSREQTASERLKARLGGARSASPNLQANAAPPRSREGSGGGYSQHSDGGGRNGSSGSVGGYNPYANDRGGDGGGSNPYGNDRGGGRSNPYSSGSNPSSRGNPYAPAPSDPYGGGGGGGGGGSRDGSKPYTAASAPWVSGDDGYGGYGGGSGGGGYGVGSGSGRPSAARTAGLPSNPRRR